MGSPDLLSHSLPRTLFVGKEASGICWYRCALPAMALGQDWVGVSGEPSALRFLTGLTARPLRFHDFFSYETVVLQQPATAEWRRAITRLREAGVRVLFEIDDYVHSVARMVSHELRGMFTRDLLRGLEQNMRACDGVICSTSFIARRYARFNSRTWVCRNGLDLRRYDVERPPAGDEVTIGWAGGVGHRAAIQTWLPAVADVLRARDHARFVTIGPPFAQELQAEFGEDRALCVPFSPMEMYPAAMSRFDLAIAPSAHNDLFRAKSDLRWLEAGAMGIPLIADPETYPGIEHGVTGFHAASADEAREHALALVDDPGLRAAVGAAARERVRSTRDARVVAADWAAVLAEPRSAGRAAA